MSSPPEEELFEAKFDLRQTLNRKGRREIERWRKKGNQTQHLRTLRYCENDEPQIVLPCPSAIASGASHVHESTRGDQARPNPARRRKEE